MRTFDALHAVHKAFPMMDDSAAKQILCAVVGVSDYSSVPFALDYWDDEKLKAEIASTVALWNHNMKPKKRRRR